MSTEKSNKINKVVMDVPLFIRMLEYAKEDAKTDMDLHIATEKITKLMSSDDMVLTMNNYDTIVSGEKKVEAKEQMSDASGSFEAPLSTPVVKRPMPNTKPKEQEFKEATTSAVSAGAAYDVPFGGGPKGRRDPLKIDGVKSIANSNAVKNKNFPKFGGPGGVFIKVKEKCKKFPYCNQGDINAIEVLREAIEEASKKCGLPKGVVEKIVLKEIKDIFI